MRRTITFTKSLHKQWFKKNPNENKTFDKRYFYVGNYLYGVGPANVNWMLSCSFVIRSFLLLLTSTIITSYTITSSLSGFYWSHQTWACAGTDSLWASVLCHGQCPRGILPSSASVRLVHKAILVIEHGNLVNCPVNRRRLFNVGPTSQTVD